MERLAILIVDDDKEIVDLIELYLAGEHYDVHKAYDGQECLRVLKKESVSLLVLDIIQSFRYRRTKCRFDRYLFATDSAYGLYQLFAYQANDKANECDF